MRQLHHPATADVVFSEPALFKEAAVASTCQAAGIIKRLRACPDGASLHRHDTRCITFMRGPAGSVVVDFKLSCLCGEVPQDGLSAAASAGALLRSKLKEVARGVRENLGRKVPVGV